MAEVLAARGRWTGAVSALDRSTALLREILQAHPGNLPAGRQLARNLLHSSILHARLATAAAGEARSRSRTQAEALYASGRRALAASMAHGSTVKDAADETLAREAAARLARAVLTSSTDPGDP